MGNFRFIEKEIDRGRENYRAEGKKSRLIRVNETSERKIIVSIRKNSRIKEYNP